MAELDLSSDHAEERLNQLVMDASVALQSGFSIAAKATAYGAVNELRRHHNRSKAHLAEVQKMNSEACSFIVFTAEKLGSADLPTERMSDRADQAIEEVLAWLETDDPANVVSAVEDAVKRVDGFDQALRLYLSNVIGGGEDAVEGLKFVSSTCLAIFLTAGGSILAQGGGMATVVIVGGLTGTVSGAGNELLRQLASGEKIDPQKIMEQALLESIATALSAGLAKGIAGHLTPYIKRAVPAEGLLDMSKKEAVTLILREIQGVGSSATVQAIKETVAALRSEDEVTVGQFLMAIAEKVIKGIIARYSVGKATN